MIGDEISLPRVIRYKVVARSVSIVRDTGMVSVSAPGRGGRYTYLARDIFSRGRNGTVITISSSIAATSLPLRAAVNVPIATRPVITSNVQPCRRDHFHAMITATLRVIIKGFPRLAVPTATCGGARLVVPRSEIRSSASCFTFARRGKFPRVPIIDERSIQCPGSMCSDRVVGETCPSGV